MPIVHVDIVEFEQGSYTVNEGDGSIEICALLHGQTPKELIQISLAVTYIGEGAASG